MAIDKCSEAAPTNIGSCEAKTPEPLPAVDHTRFLTVGYTYPKLTGTDPAQPYRAPPSPVPRLRIQGIWLKRAGFEIGAVARVQVTRGRLVVQVEPVLETDLPCEVDSDLEPGSTPVTDLSVHESVLEQCSEESSPPL